MAFNRHPTRREEPGYGATFRSGSEGRAELLNDPCPAIPSGTRPASPIEPTSPIELANSVEPVGRNGTGHPSGPLVAKPDAVVSVRSDRSSSQAPDEVKDDDRPPHQVDLDLSAPVSRAMAGQPSTGTAVARSRDHHRGREARSGARVRRAKPARQRRAIGEPSHLVAARRLSKAIRRAPSRAEETRIGRMVCSHLLALLEETGEEQSHNG